MRGPTAEKGHSPRPDLTSGTSRIILAGLNRVDCVHGPDVRRLRDAGPLPPPRLLKITLAAAETAVICLLAIAGAACL